jgi:hypothetical protein
MLKKYRKIMGAHDQHHADRVDRGGDHGGKDGYQDDSQTPLFRQHLAAHNPHPGQYVDDQREFKSDADPEHDPGDKLDIGSGTDLGGKAHEIDQKGDCGWQENEKGERHSGQEEKGGDGMAASPKSRDSGARPGAANSHNSRAM